MKPSQSTPPRFLLNDTQRKDRAFVLKVVSEFGAELQFADPTLRADPEIVLAAVTANGESFRFANKTLRKDRDFVRQVVQRDPRAIFYAVVDFKKDLEVVLEAAALDPIWVHKYAHESLRDNPTLELMVRAAQIGVKVIFVNGEISNKDEIICSGVASYGSSMLDLITPFSRPITPAHWQWIVRAAIADLERRFYEHCHGPWGGRLNMALDIVLMIDLSESMKPCLNAIKNQIAVLISRLDHFSGEIDYSLWQGSIVPKITRWRIKIAGYGEPSPARPDCWQESPFLNNTSQITSYLTSVQCAGGHDENRPLLDGLWKLAHAPVGPEGAPPDCQSWTPFHEDGQRNQRLVLAFSDGDSHVKPKSIGLVDASLSDVLMAANVANLSIHLYAPESDCHMEICTLERMYITCI